MNQLQTQFRNEGYPRFLYGDVQSQYVRWLEKKLLESSPRVEKPEDNQKAEIPPCPLCDKPITDHSLDIDDDNYQIIYCLCGLQYHTGVYDPDEAIKKWTDFLKK